GPARVAVQGVEPVADELEALEEQRADEGHLGGHEDGRRHDGPVPLPPVQVDAGVGARGRQGAGAEPVAQEAGHRRAPIGMTVPVRSPSDRPSPWSVVGSSGSGGRPTNTRRGSGTTAAGCRPLPVPAAAGASGSPAGSAVGSAGTSGPVVVAAGGRSVPAPSRTWTVPVVPSTSTVWP